MVLRRTSTYSRDHLNDITLNYSLAAACVPIFLNTFLSVVHYFNFHGSFFIFSSTCILTSMSFIQNSDTDSANDKRQELCKFSDTFISPELGYSSLQTFSRFLQWIFFCIYIIKEPRIFHFANVHNSTPGVSSLMKILSLKSEFFHQSTFFLSSFIQRSSFKDDIFINLEIKLKNYITAIYNLHRLLRAHICDKSTQITELFPSLLDTSCLNVPSLK